MCIYGNAKKIKGYMLKVLSKVRTANTKRIFYTFKLIRDEYDKFPDFFGMGTFIDSTHMKI